MAFSLKRAVANNTNAQIGAAGAAIAKTIVDAKGVNAAKYLAEKGYLPKRGRPSKEEVERERKIQAGVNKELESDMERIGLKVVNGGKE